MTAHPAIPVPPPVFSVMPLRFSEDAPSMIAFLRTLGMAPAVTSGEHSFGELVAGAGRVMVHSVAGAASSSCGGDTDLCLAVEEADGAAEHLRADGQEVDVWDETYGRQGVLAGPDGETVGLNELQRDLYGYQGHDVSGADPRLGVVAVLSSGDFDRDAVWAGRLGFRADGGDGEVDIWFRALRGPGAAGTIGLHRPAEGDVRTRPTASEFGESMQVRLGFETDEDLDELVARLREAGHPAEVVVAGDVRSVHVCDPDGQRLEIHPRRSR